MRTSYFDITIIIGFKTHTQILANFDGSGVKSNIGVKYHAFKSSEHDSVVWNEDQDQDI